MPIACFRYSATAILDPRIRRVAQLLDMPAAYVHGHLSSLWCWASFCRPDGDLTGLDEADVEALAEWGELQPEGAFARAALEVGLLEQREDGALWLMPLGVGEQVADTAQLREAAMEAA